MTGIGLILAGTMAAHADAPDVPGAMELHITAPTLATALIQFSQQTGLQLLFATDGGATSIKAPVVQGTYTPGEALGELLRNSGLTFRFVNARTISVTRAQGARTGAPAEDRPAAGP